MSFCSSSHPQGLAQYLEHAKYSVNFFFERLNHSLLEKTPSTLGHHVSYPPPNSTSGVYS